MGVALIGIGIVAVLVLLGILAVVAVSIVKMAQRRGDAALGPWEWNVQLPPGGVAGVFFASEAASYGRFRIENGHLVFFAAGREQPAWGLPLQQIGVRKLDLFTLGGADLEVSWPEGRMRCTVSRERINRAVNNDLKGFRERGYADQFVAALAAGGARVG